MEKGAIHLGHPIGSIPCSLRVLHGHHISAAPPRCVTDRTRPMPRAQPPHVTPLSFSNEAPTALIFKSVASSSKNLPPPPAHARRARPSSNPMPQNAALPYPEDFLSAPTVGESLPAPDLPPLWTTLLQ
jgi:hypothetical protein